MGRWSSTLPWEAKEASSLSVGMVGEGSPQGIGNESPGVHNPRESKISSRTPSPRKGAQSDPLPSPLRTLLDSTDPQVFFLPSVPVFPRSIRGTNHLQNSSVIPSPWVQDSCLKCPPSFLPSPHFSYFPGTLRKTLEGQIPIPTTFCPRLHSSQFSTHCPHSGPKDHPVLGNISNGPLPVLSRSVNSRLSAE